MRSHLAAQLCYSLGSVQLTWRKTKHAGMSDLCRVQPYRMVRHTYICRFSGLSFKLRQRKQPEVHPPCAIVEFLDDRRRNLRKLVCCHGFEISAERIQPSHDTREGLDRDDDSAHGALASTRPVLSPIMDARTPSPAFSASPRR